MKKEFWNNDYGLKDDRRKQIESELEKLVKRWSDIPPVPKRVDRYEADVKTIRDFYKGNELKFADEYLNYLYQHLNMMNEIESYHCKTEIERDVKQLYSKDHSEYGEDGELNVLCMFLKDKSEEEKYNDTCEALRKWFPRESEYKYAVQCLNALYDK